MNFRIAVLLIPFIFFSGNLLAQENTLTPEQIQAVRDAARKIDAACTLPVRPEVPDGGTATMDEMVSSQQALKTFIADGNAYLDCLDELDKSWGNEKTDDQAGLITSIYNQIVESMQSSATDFNDQLKVFRSKDSD